MDLELKSNMIWFILIGSLLAAVLNIDFGVLGKGWSRRTGYEVITRQERKAAWMRVVPIECGQVLGVF